MTVKSIQEAWNEVNKMFPYDYEKDEQSSENAGYPIYRATAAEHKNNWISDLGDRLEVNTEDGKSVNIWIKVDEEVMNTNNASYKVYITNSADVAHLISRGLREATPWSKNGGQTISTGSGCVNQDCRIPALYHGSDKFFAYIEYRNGEDFNHPEYELIIC